LDADADCDQDGFIDASTPNELGFCVAALCQIWYDAREAIVNDLNATLEGLAEERETLRVFSRDPGTPMEKCHVVVGKVSILQQLQDKITSGTI
jgi:hypothetical protein